jgi:hypothetical protein
MSSNPFGSLYSANFAELLRLLLTRAKSLPTTLPNNFRTLQSGKHRHIEATAAYKRRYLICSVFKTNSSLK